MALLAIVIAAFYALIPQTARLIRGGRNHYIAVNLCKDRIERTRSFQYSQLYLMAETNTIIDDNGSPISDGLFRRATIINTNYEPNLTLVTVNVEMKNVKSMFFAGETESCSAIFTEYLTR